MKLQVAVFFGMFWHSIPAARSLTQRPLSYHSAKPIYSLSEGSMKRMIHDHVLLNMNPQVFNKLFCIVKGEESICSMTATPHLLSEYLKSLKSNHPVRLIWFAWIWTMLHIHDYSCIFGILDAVYPCAVYMWECLCFLRWVIPKNWCSLTGSGVLPWGLWLDVFLLLATGGKRKTCLYQCIYNICLSIYFVCIFLSKCNIY